MCDMTHSYVCHVSSLCVPLPVHETAQYCKYSNLVMCARFTCDVRLISLRRARDLPDSCTFTVNLFTHDTMQDCKFVSCSDSPHSLKCDMTHSYVKQCRIANMSSGLNLQDPFRCKVTLICM